MKSLTNSVDHTDTSAQTNRMVLQQLLLASGIFSSLLYVIATILGANSWSAYNPLSQSVSELIGIDAPSAHIVVPLATIYSLMIYAFGVGVWRSATGNRLLRIASVLIIAKEVLGLAGLFLAPMHLRGVEKTSSDSLHLIITGVGVLLCMFPAIGFAAAALGKRFRIYSIATMVVFLVFGTLAGMEGPKVDANLPTPYLGIYERINIFGYLLWIIVLAVILFRKKDDPLEK